eukprot:3646758-Karenia_brevis.AAC.1
MASQCLASHLLSARSGWPRTTQHGSDGFRRGNQHASHAESPIHSTLRGLDLAGHLSCFGEKTGKDSLPSLPQISWHPHL